MPSYIVSTKHKIAKKVAIKETRERDSTKWVTTHDKLSNLMGETLPINSGDLGDREDRGDMETGTRET